MYGEYSVSEKTHIYIITNLTPPVKGYYRIVTNF